MALLKEAPQPLIEQNILHEVGAYYVYKTDAGKCEIRKNTCTHSEVKGRVSFSDENIMTAKAIEICNRMFAEDSQSSINWKTLIEQEPYMSFESSYYMSPMLFLDMGENKYVIGYFCAGSDSYWIENEEGESVGFNLERWAEIPRNS